MADDIDIEEHDVLDNPRIRNIFPDLSQIFPDSDDDKGHHMQTDCHDEPKVNNHSSSQLKQSTHNNHIILGKKRIVDLINYEDSSPISDYNFNEEHSVGDTNVDYEFDDVQIKQEPEDSHDEEIERHGSLIILGSKPYRSTPETETHDVYSSVVILEDWGPKLQRSNCYCKNCEILFPTRNCLDAHNMATHSFLVAVSDDPESLDTSQTVKTAVSVNKAMKSTAKDLHFSTQSTLSKPSTSKEKFCNHCNKLFPSKAALITHLYENLSAQKFPCKECDKIFNTEQELSQHIEARHAEEDDDETPDKSKGRLYYQCDVCFCYFRRSFSRHMLRNHGKSTFSRKRVPFCGICKICGFKYSSSKNLSRHVSTAHSEYTAKVKSNKNPNMQQVGSANHSDSRKPNFKCLKCGESFVAYNAAKRHKKSKHPEMLNRKIFSKIKRVPVLTKKPIKQTIRDKNTFTYNGVANPPIPKSVLFKCNKCPLHFTNCTNAVSHAYGCVREIDVWDCDICSKRFKIGDKIIHERQHAVSDRFSVHLTNDSVYGRTLCQCPKCDIYYSEQEFWVHLKQGCSQPRSAPCNICDLLIHVSSTKMHKKLHIDKKFNTKDLILIEFVSFENEASDKEDNLFIGSKRKIPDDYKASNSKKSKISTEKNALTKTLRTPMKNIMYYCEKCKIYWKSSRVNVYHEVGNCSSRKSRVCKKCGLYYSSDYHNMMMHKSHETIFDFIFMRVQDKKVINPMPSYPKCLKCNVHYLNKMDKWKHICNNNYKICQYCKKMFTKTAYALHVTFHEYALRKGSKTGISNKAQGSSAKKEVIVAKPGFRSVNKTLPRNSPPMPELLKKYELMTNTWNILYLCEVCDIVCDSYDKMVEHSQDHFNKMESYDMTIANCDICDLRFDGTCFDKHKDMHDENATLDRRFFNILKYNYMNLFSGDWFELFGVLPRNQIEQIVSKSIYLHDRNIRMRITRHGSPENTVYKCGRCHGYLTASMVGDHYERQSCWPPRYRCNFCHLDFSMNVCLKEHQTVCRTTCQDYREVLFNDVKDDSFNKGLQMTWKPDKSSTNTTHIKTKNTLFKFYKCEICQCCVMLTSKTIKHHRCIKPSERVKCGQCDLYFNPRTLYSRHRPYHIKFPKLSRSTVMTIPFNPKSHNVLPKLYKCQCGLHFTSLQTAEKHLAVCKPGFQISKEHCSKCGLLFPTSVLVSHLCSHHSNDKRTEFNIQHMTPKRKGHGLMEGVKRKTNSKVTIHKCDQCDVCFFTKPTLMYHFTSDHKINLDIQHCNLCGVNFTKYSMTRHVYLHHEVRQCSRADLNIVVYRKNANQITEELPSNDNANYKTISPTKPKRGSSHGNKYLYKCCRCKIHFLTLDGCRLHYSRYHETSNNAVQKSTNCHVCGLAFTQRSLDQHMQIHHEKIKLNRENFIIIQSGPAIRKELYKCDRCDVHFITHKAYLKHCYKGIHSVNKLACEFCGYHFISNALQWHINMHHKSLILSREDFNIITETKSRNQDTETQNYTAEVTNRLYRCRTCSVHFCKEMDLIQHVSETSVSGHDDSTAVCQYCHLKFTPGKGIDRHVNEQHKRLNLTNEFIIIENDDVDGAYVTRYLYKCEECNTNFLKEAVAELHNHEIGKSKCRVCGLFFGSDELSDHKNYHHNMMNMSLDDFIFVNICKSPKSASSRIKVNKEKHVVRRMYKFSKKGKASLNISSYDNTIYSCSCGLHYLILKTFKSHLAECNRTSGSKATCKICGLSFGPRSLAIHQYIQHEKLKLKLEDFCIVTEKDLEQCNDTGLDNRKISTDLHDANSVTQTKSTEQKQTPSNTTNDSESTQSPCNSARSSKLIYNFSRNYLSSLNMNNYSNQLYRCNICHNHYITFSAAVKHEHVPGEKCTICGLLFTNYILLKHKYIHHERLGLNRDDFLIHYNFDKPELKYPVVYKCVKCDMHFTKFTAAYAHTDERCAMAICEEDLNCNYCGLRFSACSLENHKTEHHLKKNLKSKDLYIIHYSGAASSTGKTKTSVDAQDISSIENRTDFDESEISIDKTEESEIGDVNEPETSSLQMDVSHDSLDSSVIKPSTSDSSKSPQKNVIKLYKCGDCNVFYITQSTCYKHVVNHKPLESMEYIECKLCGLQFRILTLHRHMIKHHKTDFNLKNVLIEEYQSTKDKTPKIDIYNAFDKVQSRLVSTTTDSKEVSEGKVDSTVEDGVGPVNNQENNEKATHNTEIEQIATNSTEKNTTSPTVTIDMVDDNSNSPEKNITSPTVTIDMVDDNSNSSAKETGTSGDV